MTNPYVRGVIGEHTLASSAQINGELSKIEQAFLAIQQRIDALQTGGSASFMWIAFADSPDGTVNFTTGDPGTRAYIGIAANRSVPTESNAPADYSWSLIRGQDGTDGSNGSNGVNGGYRDWRFARSAATPTAAFGNDPAGWSNSIPAGGDPIWFVTVDRDGGGAMLGPWSAPARLSALSNAAPYSASTTYYEGALVLFGGGTYILVVPQSTGNAPSGTDQANAWWDVIAAPGAPGEPATPPSAFSATIDLASSIDGLNLRAVAEAAGYTGLSDANITFRVPAGVTVMGTPYGGNGVDTGTWPSGYAATLALVVQSGGTVLGGGGKGGDGGVTSAGYTGGNGGTAINCRQPISITIDAGGIVRGGGGGGGGGTGRQLGGAVYAGGGGGGGFPNGIGGEPGAGDYEGGFGGNGGIGGPGNGAAGGAPHGGSGANGGNAATAGGNVASGAYGGQAGSAIRKNGLVVHVTNNGTVTGSIEA